ncbi:MAG: hypothetical protein ACRD0C_16900, partial [Acidimicrobiia bacterium]
RRSSRLRDVHLEKMASLSQTGVKGNRCGAEDPHGVWAATLDEHDGDVQREDVLMGIRITAAASAC